MKESALAALTALALLASAGVAQAQSYSPSMTYPNPDGNMNSIRARGPCGDPWVTVALEIVNGRADPALCAVGLYNGGQWSSFNQLIHAVAATRNALASSGSRLSVERVQGASYSVIALWKGGSMVAAGGGNMVAAGGGNIVAAGGGNLLIINNRMVAAGGGNLVSPGGGNIAPVATIRQGYSLQSGRSVRLPTGGIGF